MAAIVEISSMDIQRLQTELEQIVGQENVEYSEGAFTRIATPVTWENRPLGTVMPSNVEEIAAIVKAVESESAAILPCGNGSRFSIGYPPDAKRPYILLRTSRMDRILDYQPEDMTITCETGISIATLQETLVARGQYLALDPPLPELSTIGSMAAMNSTGFWQPSIGTPRDLIIGLRAVMTGGAIIRGGGKVVKNVAGYDLCKLFTGSRGTLGILTELTFKVHPLPEATATASWRMPDEACAARIGLKLHLLRLAPSYIIASNEPEGKPRLIIGLQGTKSRIKWQAEEFNRLITSEEEGQLTSLNYLSETVFRQLHNSQARRQQDLIFSARISCLPDELPQLAAKLQKIQALKFTLHCATGIVNLMSTEFDPAILSQVRSLVPHSANILWTHLDSSLVALEDIPLWGVKREDFLLQRSLKQALDPKATFSPGRFVGRI